MAQALALSNSAITQRLSPRPADAVYGTMGHHGAKPVNSWKFSPRPSALASASEVIKRALLTIISHEGNFAAPPQGGFSTHTQSRAGP
jgi:hypothetical protein